MAIRRLLFRFVVLVLSSVLYGVDAKDKKHGNTIVKMPHHCFAEPMAYRELLDDWLVSGASVFEQNRLLLHPAVPERMGFLWSRNRLLTHEFEIDLYFKVLGKADQTANSKDQSFAVWYLEESIANSFQEKDFITASSWKAAMDEEGFTFSGSKAKFNGFGVVLSMFDSAGATNPVMHFVTNDGSKALSYGTDAPTRESIPFAFRNKENPVGLRILVSFDGIHLETDDGSGTWTHRLKVPVENPSGPRTGNGYVGVTAWSGAGGDSDLVSISKLEVLSHDETSIGEDMHDVSMKIQDAYREMLMDKNRHFVDQKSQMEHLQRLTGVLADHAKEAHNIEQQLFSDLQRLEDRMGNLDADSRALSTSFKVLVNPTGNAGVGALYGHIAGLRELIVKHGVEHGQRVAEVYAKVKEVKEKHAQNQNTEAFTALAHQGVNLERTADASSTRMFGMLLVLVACVFVIGVLLYNRMQYYEKRHFL